MDSPKNIKIPEHWLIDTGITTYWPHKEGIWVDKGTESILRLVAVYHNLMDIPEAKSQLTQCNDQFVNDFASELLGLFNPVMVKARVGKTPSTPQLSEAENEKIVSIYKQWVDTWALGSNKMLVWVSGSNIYQTIFNMLPFSRSDLRRLESRLAKIGGQVSPPWVLKTLLSGDYQRLDQTKRELARRTMQSQGYYRKRERELLTFARYWIIVRVIGYGETDLVNKLQLDNESFNYVRENFSTKVLKPFDLALLEADNIPKLGRPLGTRTSETARILSEL